VVGYYGYNANGTLVPDPTVIQAPGHNVEANKTEPDKNTYLRLHGLTGADPSYDYGTHFLYQGHETGVHGYITRINLDADAAHRVTLIADNFPDGSPLPTIDGSTWDPWAKRLLFTTESGGNASVIQSTQDIGATVQDISPALGRGGYEGIQNDSAGNLWVVEDVGGTVPSGTNARNPNSFVYRFVPYDKADLAKGGKLQALQVVSARTHTPITFQAVDAAHPTGGIFTDDRKDLSTYGTTFDTTWVTIHDTAVDTSGAPFNANAAAKAAGATPFKRPENGVFRPGTDFREFYFDATGDTNATSTANDGYGGWGTVYKLTQSDPSSDHGRLSVFYQSDKEHSGFDNVTFLDKDHMAFVEDAGDTLHSQRNALDSGYLFDVRLNYATGAQPIRFLAEGRDAAATQDAMFAALGNGFPNEGDNEITGIHFSDGDPGVGGILGAKLPQPFHDGWRLFWTQQHGDNVTWEVVPADG
jgi:secreted PhoX family phosphatase